MPEFSRLLPGVIRVRYTFICCLAASLVLAVIPGPAEARPETSVVIDFEQDPAGHHPEPFTSVDSPVVHFWDSQGDDLDTADTTPESHGLALRVFSDDQGYLRMSFDVDVCELEMWFGNDDPGFSNPGDLARLRVWHTGGTGGSSSAVVLNRNDVMDQLITVHDAAPFNRAEFWYDVTTPGLIEIVDDIQFRPCRT